MDSALPRGGRKKRDKMWEGKFFYLRGDVLNVKESGMVNALMMRRFFWTNTERPD